MPVHNEFWMMQFTLYEYIRYSNSMQDSFAERELRSQIYFFPNMNVIKLQIFPHKICLAW